MINLFSEETSFSLRSEEAICTWLEKIALAEGLTINTLNYIFCNDEYLHSMNVQYLSHDTLTDIITFDNSQDPSHIEGDIFISIDRVEDNAADFKVPFDRELHRVMAHGLLHLLGYKDKSPEEKTVMRQKEEACLSLLS